MKRACDKIYLARGINLFVHNVRFFVLIFSLDREGSRDFFWLTILNYRAVTWTRWANRCQKFATTFEQLRISPTCFCASVIFSSERQAWRLSYNAMS